jgi:hypothetical protein
VINEMQKKEVKHKRNLTSQSDQFNNMELEKEKIIIEYTAEIERRNTEIS